MLQVEMLRILRGLIADSNVMMPEILLPYVRKYIQLAGDKKSKKNILPSKLHIDCNFISNGDIIEIDKDGFRVVGKVSENVVVTRLPRRDDPIRIRTLLLCEPQFIRSNDKAYKFKLGYVDPMYSGEIVDEQFNRELLDLIEVRAKDEINEELLEEVIQPNKHKSEQTMTFEEKSKLFDQKAELAKKIMIIAELLRNDFEVVKRKYFGEERTFIEEVEAGREDLRSVKKNLEQKMYQLG